MYNTTISEISHIEEFKFVSKDIMNNAMNIVKSIDFTIMNDKLVNHYKWSKNDVSLMDDYYKKWLSLQICYPELEIAPSEKLDDYWHNHILDTKKYMNDCQIIFGEYLHHYPYFGLEGDKSNLDSAFAVTKTLFKTHFGHDLTGLANPCKSTSCR